jgi:hypothetical protein
MVSFYLNRLLPEAVFQRNQLFTLLQAQNKTWGDRPIKGFAIYTN